MRLHVQVGLLTVFLAAGYLAAQEMNLVKLHVDSFTIAGLSVRTSNSRETTTDAAIPKLWQRLSNENYLREIPNRVDDRVIALYTDYENGRDGMYTYVLGAKVSSRKNMPVEFVAREVASGQYAMFTEHGGPPPQMTVDLWKGIWALEKPGVLERAYKTDYEVHYGPADDVAKSHVDIYIGLLGKK
jgi:predicted transcriptional regulator YdeE